MSLAPWGFTQQVIQSAVDGDGKEKETITKNGAAGKSLDQNQPKTTPPNSGLASRYSANLFYTTSKERCLLWPWYVCVSA